MNTTQIVSRERSIFFPKLHSPSNSSDTNRLQDNTTINDVEGKMKNRFLSMWNNVKYGKVNNCLNNYITQKKCYLLSRHETEDKFLKRISCMAVRKMLPSY